MGVKGTRSPEAAVAWPDNSCIASNSDTNTMEYRTVSGIALGPDHSTPGNYRFMSLATGRPISRHQWTPMVITPEVIARVHELADGEHATDDGDSRPVSDPFLFEWAPGIPVPDETPAGFPGATQPDTANTPTQTSETATNEESEKEESDDDDGDDDFNSDDDSSDGDFDPNDDDSSQEGDHDLDEEFESESEAEDESPDHKDEDPEYVDEEQLQNSNPSTQDEHTSLKREIQEEEEQQQQYPLHTVDEDDPFEPATIQTDEPTESNNDNTHTNEPHPVETTGAQDEPHTAEKTGAQDEHNRTSRSNPNLFQAPDKYSGNDRLRLELGKLEGHNNPPTTTNSWEANLTSMHAIRVRTPSWTTGLSKAVQTINRRELVMNCVHNRMGATRELVGIFLNQMSAKKGIKTFGDQAIAAIIKEFKQIDDMGVVDGLDASTLTKEEIEGALRSITLIKQKRCGKIKGRTVADGRVQRSTLKKEDVYSPTVATESFLVTLGVDAKERRHVAACDIAGAYLNAYMPDKVIMVIEGDMVDYMIGANEKYAQFVTYNKHGKKLLYLRLVKALYGCMQSALLWWQMLYGALQEIGFERNPYDHCVANKTLEDGTQLTICWYVDDVKISHVRREEVEKVIEAIEAKFGKLTIQHGPKFKYLGMQIELTEDGTAIIRMDHYIEDAFDSFGEAIGTAARTPAGEKLFIVKNSELLPEAKRKIFHSVTAKLLYLGKRARPDILVPIAFLTSRVTKATKSDWEKLRRVLRYLKGTKDLPLTISMDNLTIVKSWVDASFGVHEDLKSHTGGYISLGKGTFYARSSRQALNTASSTEAELVAAGDMLPQIIWTQNFLRAQGYELRSEFNQDNQSAMKLEKNGKASVGKRSRHINVRFFLIKDYIERKELNLVYCETENMVADFFTKPLQGKLFEKFRDIIMGVTHPDSLRVSTSESQERVGDSPKLETLNEVDNVSDDATADEKTYADIVRRASTAQTVIGD